MLLVFPGALGDLLLLAPAARALAAGGARMELCVARVLAPLAALLGPGGTGPFLDAASMSGLFGGPVTPALAAWIRGADVVHAWLARTVEADSFVARLRALGAAEVRLHAVRRDDADEHASVAYASDLRCTLAAENGPALAVPLDPARPPSVEGAPRLVVHPGAGASAKRWSTTGFARVADCWRARGGEVVVLLGPADDDLAAAWRATGHALATGRTLLEAAALVASASRYVGNDSGISHLAGALDRTGAVLFGPTRPEHWRPRGGRLAVVRFTSRDESSCVEEIVAHLGAPDEGRLP